MDARGDRQVLVVSERNGRWDRAIEVSGTAVLNVGCAQVLALSCVSPGNCAVAGYASGYTPDDP